ncbi:MAG TPA: pyridoxal-phosphate dependent enzyme, partial [Nocardioides sp.]|nr:pyridoxal-phosphate dependent enzyme [Nocardioides sp.]
MLFNAQPPWLFPPRPLTSRTHELLRRYPIYCGRILPPARDTDHQETPLILDQFERHPLTFGPSPVHHLRRLSDHLAAQGGGAQVWAKREDVSSPLAFGGNKVRKLEYIVPDVLASGADTLVSIGGYQSNHTRQVAAVAAHLGLKCRLVQEKWVPWDDPTN